MCDRAVDWSAVVWVDIIAGSVTLMLNILARPGFIGSNGRLVIRYFVSIALGEGVWVKANQILPIYP